MQGEVDGTIWADCLGDGTPVVKLQLHTSEWTCDGLTDCSYATILTAPTLDDIVPGDTLRPDSDTSVWQCSRWCYNCERLTNVEILVDIVGVTDMCGRWYRYQESAVIDSGMIALARCARETACQDFYALLRQGNYWEYQWHYQEACMQSVTQHDLLDFSRRIDIVQSLATGDTIRAAVTTADSGTLTHYELGSPQYSTYEARDTTDVMVCRTGTDPQTRDPDFLIYCDSVRMYSSMLVQHPLAPILAVYFYGDSSGVGYGGFDFAYDFLVGADPYYRHIGSGACADEYETGLLLETNAGDV